MAEAKWQDAVLLSAGGLRPHVDVLSPNGDKSTIVELRAGQGMYSVDRCPETAALAFGTRDGQVVVLGHQGWKKEEEGLNPSISLLHGSPVLSVCWMDGLHLAGSDLAGRVLLWNLSDQTNPHLLNTGKEVVCALCRVRKDTLAGLTVEGRLLFWRGIDVDPVRSISLLPPPPKFALVRLEYVPQSDTVYYPGRQGQLISIRVDGEDQRHLHAHENDFYAFSVCGERIVTAGLLDHGLKVWRGQEGDLVAEYPLEQGIISMAAFPGHPELIAAITEAGLSYIIDLRDGSTSAGQNRGFGDYRCAFPSVPSKQLQIVKMDSVQTLISQLELALGQEDLPTAGILHERLTEMGYEYLALDMRSDWELTKGNYLTALRHSAPLRGMLSIEDPGAWESLRRHAQLLSRFWVLDQAFALYARLHEADPSVANPLCNLEQLLCKEAGMEIIVDSDIALEEIIEAHTILQQGFKGTFILSRQDTNRCQGISLSPADMAHRFNGACRQSSPEIPVHARAKAAGILSPSGSKRETIFEITACDGVPHAASFGLLIDNSVAYTDVTPVVLFTWKGEDDYQEANGLALEYLQNLRSGAVDVAFLDRSYRLAMDLVKRLVTEAQTAGENAL